MSKSGVSRGVSNVPQTRLHLASISSQLTHALRIDITCHLMSDFLLGCLAHSRGLVMYLRPLPQQLPQQRNSHHWKMIRCFDNNFISRREVRCNAHSRNLIPLIGWYPTDTGPCPEPCAMTLLLADYCLWR